VSLTPFLQGCEFGITIWGWSGTSYCPGTEQIDHFVDQGANIVRIPFGWQYMVTDQSSTTLVESYFAQYDALVQATTAKGAYALLDLHNYARWNSGVVGVDGPSNEAFASLWALLAAKYANNPLVMFGLMNEPHDLDISVFATSCQAAVNAIRSAGAKSQTIVLPGNSWDNAGVWSSGANAPMLAITDPASSDKSALILDVHKYIDSDGSGQSTTCTNNGLDLLTPLVSYLQAQGRKAILSEIGAAPTSSCLTYFPQMMDYIVANSDTLLGFTIWSAGSFQPYPNYELSIVPNADGSDNEFFVSAVKPYLPGVTATASTTATTATSTAAATSTTTVSTATATPTTTTTATTTTTNAPTTTVDATTDITSAPAYTPSSAAAEPSSATAEPSVAAPEISAEPSVAAPEISAEPSVTVPEPVVPTESATSPESESAAPTSAESESPCTHTHEAPTPSSATEYTTPYTTPTAVAPPSTSAPAPSASAPAPGSGAGNLQPFGEALGGFTAPEVTKQGDFWYIGEQRYNFLIDALNQSCYKQMDACQLAANRGGNVGSLTVSNCETTQITACLASARAASA
jgi:hypothetical protein